MRTDWIATACGQPSVLQAVSGLKIRSLRDSSHQWHGYQNTITVLPYVHVANKALILPYSIKPSGRHSGKSNS
ncbi:MAG: hypothetical protein Q7V63_02890 [Gammaproteobacteria bacterium]|nr:hypothetical protein [Gammaproteobacteria bacterium]